MTELRNVGPAPSQENGANSTRAGVAWNPNTSNPRMVLKVCPRASSHTDWSQMPRS